MKKNKIKVAIAMSGGVDSSVAAKLLLDQGYIVIGFMMKLWSEDSKTPGKENACCDIKGVEDARRVANQLGIPFYLVDAREEFKKHVVDYFIEEYKNLRTPNPCVVCNEKIKFGWLLDFAKKSNCDFLATGHYSRIEKDNAGYHLIKAKDENKDQSYFLYNLNQDQLSKILFPIGEFTKPEVREMAKKWKLPVHKKKESQEICFVKEKDFREFLRRHIPKELFKPGDIVTGKGIVVGKHDGLINYTIGQRKGIEQSQKSKIRNQNDNSKFINKEPLYVIGYNINKNQLIVGKDSKIYKNEMAVGGVNRTSIGNEQLAMSDKHLTIKIRYRHKAVPVKSIVHNSKFIIRFKEPQRAVTPGQSAVFYLDDEVLGGGIIEK
jgi:tRNA-uridine 2-sulfurtransferase